MKIVETAPEFRALRSAWHRADLSSGFVPTMGALHEGHMALVARAGRECARVTVSLFVNPTQFNDPADLERYPQPRAKDLALLEQARVDAVFIPRREEIYADGYRFELHEKELSAVLCGPKRPGHFAGVLTVVLKLLNIVQPSRAYFGEKEFQQLRLIEALAKALFLDSEIVACPTVRAADGLALSSRNALLTPAQRELAPALYHCLMGAASGPEAARRLTELGFAVEYVEEHWGRRFAAASLGQVRLIDNVVL